MSDEEDFLEELIAESTRQNPDFPKLFGDAMQRRRHARARGEGPNAEPEDDVTEEKLEHESSTGQTMR